MNVSPVEAAGITLAAQTAYQALYDKGKIEEGMSVFINGGSTAVGSFAIQIAKAAGTKVIATASAKNEQYVRNLGADEVSGYIFLFYPLLLKHNFQFIDYTKVDLPKFLSQNAPSPKYNIIFDAAGLVSPALYTYSESYLAPNGVFVTVGQSNFTTLASSLWNILKTIGAISTPTFLGGTKRKYRSVWIGIFFLRELTAM